MLGEAPALKATADLNRCAPRPPLHNSAIRADHAQAGCLPRMHGRCHASPRQGPKEKAPRKVLVMRSTFFPARLAAM
ncbi:MAG: hypothetical protein ABW154_12130, partial [Dyella sp.]